MKRLLTLAAFLAILTLTGCSNGILGGGCNTGCSSTPSTFGNGGLFSDGPIRQFMRGDACDSCNAHAGQVSAGSAPFCNSCSSPSGDPFANPVNVPIGNVMNAPFGNPVGAPISQPGISQPGNSFFRGDTGASLGQPIMQDGGFPAADPGSIGTDAGFGAFDTSFAEPPSGM